MLPLRSVILTLPFGKKCNYCAFVISDQPRYYNYEYINKHKNICYICCIIITFIIIEGLF